MMRDQEKLYETLGELLYVVAKVDGVIQDEEVASLNKLLEKHPWGKEVQWSFNYEVAKNSSMEEIYHKVVSYCHSHGPSPIYQEFIDAMNTIAEAANGVEDSETEIIESFSADLMERFRKDIEKRYEV
ncbi:TerB family tellurite resistance protein [Algivirga pacifica]|uniref:Tellurite resistance protein TerB n=1 Tax=Algivirga pacifica TaxID=1162670 RepID=A0ABP9DPJ5_9BACT